MYAWTANVAGANCARIKFSAYHTFNYFCRLSCHIMEFSSGLSKFNSSSKCLRFIPVVCNFTNAIIVYFLHFFAYNFLYSA